MELKKEHTNNYPERKFSFIDIFLLSQFFFVLCYLLFFSNKGFLHTDGAFYTFHYIKPYLQTIDIWNWHYLWRPFSTNNFVYDQRIILILLALSALFFSNCFVRAFKIHILSRFDYFLVASCQFVLLSPVGYDPSYITFNLILSNLALGIVFWSKTQIHTNSLLFLSGFLIGFIPFNQITASPIIPIIIIFVIYYFKSWKASLYMILGCLLSVFTFFIFLENPETFIKHFLVAKNSLNDPNEVHGIHPIVFWFKQIMFEMGFEYFLITIFFFLYRKKLLKWLRYLVFLIICVFVLITLKSSLLNPNYIVFTHLFYTIILFLILHQIDTISRYNLNIIIFLFCIPVFLNLGTNVPFYIRSAINFPTIVLMIFILLSDLKYKLTPKLVLISFVMILLNFIAFPFRGCWENYVPTKQTIPVSFKSTKVYLDKQRYALYKQLKPLISKKKNIVTLSPKLLGTMLLCEASPPIVHSFPSVYLMKAIDNMNLSEVYIIYLKEDSIKTNHFLNILKNYWVKSKKTTANTFVIILINKRVLKHN